MTNLKKLKNELSVLKQLLKNGRQSDRQIAKNIGVSQPTVSRARIVLEQNHFYEYAVMPFLEKLGFEIMAVTFIKDMELPRMTSLSYATSNKVIFASRGEGLGYSSLTISVHKNFNDFLSFKRQIKGKAESFLICLKTHQIVKHMSFKNLEIQ